MLIGHTSDIMEKWITFDLCLRNPSRVCKRRKRHNQYHIQAMMPSLNSFVFDSSSILLTCIIDFT